MWNTKIYVATEADGLDVTNLVMVMEINPMLIKNEDDFVKAVMSASTEYCLTDEGKKTYEFNCNNFNWGDFDTYVPNEICEKYGIKKVMSNVSGEFCFNQQLVDKTIVFPEIEQIRATNIDWDTDDEEIVLPTTVIVSDEFLDSVYDNDEDSRIEKISDWLSNEYDFCHKGFKLVYLTDNDLNAEKEKLKRAIIDTGVNAIEEFLGHPLDSDEIDVESEINDCIAQMSDDEYLKYLSKYVKITLKYFDIHFTVKNDCKEGYSVFIAMPANSSEDEAIQEMINQHLYEEPEDLDNIDYVGEISEKEYREAKGIH